MNARAKNNFADQTRWEDGWRAGKLEAHELCSKLRRMTDDEAADLRQQIAAAGFDPRHPITMISTEDGDQILDGLNRYHRSRELLEMLEQARDRLPADHDEHLEKMVAPLRWDEGWKLKGASATKLPKKLADAAANRIMPVFDLFRGSREEARDFVWRENIARRQLSVGARAMLYVELYGQLKDEGKRRREQNLKRGQEQPSMFEEPPPKEDKRGRSRDIAAAKAGVSPNAMDRVSYVTTHAPEVLGEEKAKELQEDVVAEKVSLDEAWKTTRQAKKNAEREAAREEMLARPTQVDLVSASKWMVEQGDAAHLLEATDQMFDLIHADPPYFLSSGKTTVRGGQAATRTEAWDEPKTHAEKLAWNLRWLRPATAKAKPNAALIIHGTRHNIFEATCAALALGWHVIADLCWSKPAPPPRLRPGIQDDHEWIVILARKKLQIDTAPLEAVTGSCRATVRCGPPKEVERAFGAHPTQKPVELAQLLQKLVRLAEGQIVCVPFAGAGTEAVAAVGLGATVHAYETDPKWVDTTRARLQALAQDDAESEADNKDESSPETVTVATVEGDAAGEGSGGTHPNDPNAARKSDEADQHLCTVLAGSLAHQAGLADVDISKLASVERWRADTYANELADAFVCGLMGHPLEIKTTIERRCHDLGEALRRREDARVDLLRAALALALGYEETDWLHVRRAVTQKHATWLNKKRVYVFEPRDLWAEIYATIAGFVDELTTHQHLDTTDHETHALAWEVGREVGDQAMDFICFGR